MMATVHLWWAVTKSQYSVLRVPTTPLPLPLPLPLPPHYWLTVALSGCNDAGNTGGSGTLAGTALTTGSGTITWSGTGSTTLGNVTTTVMSPNICPAGKREYEVNGVVTGGKGTAPQSILTGYTLQAYVCVGPNGHIHLVAGVKFNIGPSYN